MAGLALVTGASSGIGLALAHRFADGGHDLVIAAENDAVHDAARELDRPGIRVVPVQVDLSTGEGVERLCAQVSELAPRLDAVALNAGTAHNGPFVEDSLETVLRVVDLNCRSTIHLARRLLPPMVGARRGRVLVTSSIAARSPGPYHAVYAASKAFVLSFAEAIRYELRDTGVSVTSLIPGATDTEIFDKGTYAGTRIEQGHKDDPNDVARQAYEALMAGKHAVITGGLRSKVPFTAARLLPDPLAARGAARETKPPAEETQT
jgi:uncharacterized protein